MWQAVLTLLGVILGAAIAGGISLWQVQLVTTKERETRQELREQERKDRRDAFQRDTIIALQDALGDLDRAIAREQKRWFAEYPATGKWTAKRLAAPIDDLDEALWIIGKLRARIFDQELRDLARRMQGAVLSLVRATDLETMEEPVDRVNEIRRLLNERVAVLLKDLF